MPDQEENYQPFPLYEQPYSTEPNYLNEGEQQEVADRMGQLKKIKKEEVPENLGRKTENEEPGSDSVAPDVQQETKTRLDNMRQMAKEQATGAVKEIAAEATKKVAKKVASAAWKKVALWIAGLIGPEVGGVLLAIAVVIFVVLFTLAMKCEIVKNFGFLKPILGWVGVTCEI
ncbi:MAG: hypothetical protein PHT40_01945 [Patescibacteria group bacterium]|nr:hypothetical protein [Patescibacteria group bacterium]